MFLDIAKLAALLLCQLSLYAVFHATFLVPNASELLFSEAAQTAHILHTLWLLVFAAGICLSSGLLYRDAAPLPRPSLTATLPVKLLTWSTSIMLLLFLLSWYLETHVPFYRSPNPW
jgi:hypothetical protein